MLFPSTVKDIFRDVIVVIIFLKCDLLIHSWKEYIFCQPDYVFVMPRNLLLHRSTNVIRYNVIYQSL